MSLRLFAVVFAAFFLLTACGEKPGSGEQMILTSTATQFNTTDITGLDWGKDFALKDHNGKPRTLADFRGKAVVMFFGYTHCPDVCPTTMAEMSAVMKELGPLADRVQVLFVTIDPERDTAELLSKYVPAFDPRFLGLIGDKNETAKVANEFKIVYQKSPGKDPGSYTMDHTSASYVFDPQGRIRLYVRPGQGIGPLVHDLKLLLS